MSEAIVPDGSFAGLTYTDQRGQGEKMAAGVQSASMAGMMAGAFIPNPEIQQLITPVAKILGKLVPVLREIDFYKSTSTYTTFDGRAWYTRSVTHYTDPVETDRR